MPKIPSYRIIDVAEAIAPSCPRKIIGIRPGEKLHEEMITNTDAMHTIEFNDYFVIPPSIEWQNDMWSVEELRKESTSQIGKMCEHDFTYNSGSNCDFLSVDQIRELIKDNLNY